MVKEMKICAIADLHTLIDNFDFIPKGSVLVVAGDFSNTGALVDAKSFNQMIATIKNKYKIIVAGNHDIAMESNMGMAKDLLSNAIYLMDEAIIIDGVKFYGTPWQLPFNDWAFNKPEKELKEIFSMIPSDTNVLISHSPPYGILDMAYGKHLGSKSLRDRVEKIKPKYHIFGHIHEGYGRHIDEQRGITYVNASLLDGNYRYTNKPWILKI